MLALEIICDAVDHYKELCEGAYCGAHLSHASCLQPAGIVDMLFAPCTRLLQPCVALHAADLGSLVQARLWRACRPCMASTSPTSPRPAMWCRTLLPSRAPVPGGLLHHC